MIRIGIFITFLQLSFYVGSLNAETLAFKPLVMEVNEGDQIEVDGFNGSLSFESSDSIKNLTIRFERKAPGKDQELYKDWALSVHKESSVVRLKVTGPLSKKEWDSVVLGKIMPEFNITILAPPLKTDVVWNDGKVIFKNWKKDVRVTLQQGNIQLLGGEGFAELDIQDGSIDILKRKGGIKAKSYSARVRIEDAEGQVEVDNFMGQSLIQRVAGDLNYASTLGQSQLRSVKGKLDFANGRSPLKIDDFEGTLRGNSGQGAVNVSITGEANVRLKTMEGPVVIKMPGSGAHVNVGSSDGFLRVPNYLKLTRYPTIKVRQGRLRGSKRGSVFVRTQSGDIKIQ